MARARTPDEKAKISGAASKNPKRFKNRKPPKVIRKLGDPYRSMTKVQKACWLEMEKDIFWLDCTHRPLVRLACIQLAKMEENNDLGVQAGNLLSSILSKIGATPSDVSKVSFDPEENQTDPAEKFFTH